MLFWLESGMYLKSRRRFSSRDSRSESLRMAAGMVKRKLTSRDTWAIYPLSFPLTLRFHSRVIASV